MATITGSTGVDTLTGTSADDVLIGYGTGAATGADLLIGLEGNDTYDLQRTASGGLNFVIDDRGSDTGDAITHAGALYHSASLGYQGWATAERVGDDLVIHTPAKPYRFHDPAIPAWDIRIVDHFAGHGVESFDAAGVSYALSATGLGTAGADMIAGGRLAESLEGFGGDDWIWGNGGRDTVQAGDGSDVAFGGQGGDFLHAGAGNDTVFGGIGNDRILGDAGADWLEGEDGNDKILAGAEDDRVYGGAGRDLINGGDGQDWIDGGEGDDRMTGGRGGDTYVMGAGLGDPGFGHDTIREAGDKPGYLNEDVIRISGVYGPNDGATWSEAMARLSFDRLGNDMVLTVDDGSLSELTVLRMFDANANRWAIEHLELNAAYWGDYRFWFLDSDHDATGDDRDYSPLYSGTVNEVMFGNDGANDFFGNSGTNFIWTGAGADVLIYKENDPQSLGLYGGGASHDIVLDFDVTQDRMDFSEIGLGFGDLAIGTNAEGDATVAWASGDIEISSILVELRGVAQAAVTEDLFLF